MKAETGDFVKASVSVRVPQEIAFTLFVEKIDQWWRRGPRFRQAGENIGMIHIEPSFDGRVFESWQADGNEVVFEVGRVTEWSPPSRLAFTWRNADFTDNERTLVEIDFVTVGATTLVSVIHRGWSAIRSDHPARNGQDVPVFQRSLGMWWGDQLTHFRMNANAG